MKGNERKVKLYPFSGTKHAHDIEFRRARVKNELSEAVQFDGKRFVCKISDEEYAALENLEERLAYAAEKNIGIVLGSTGFTAEDNKRIEEYAKKIPVFKTANLSLGINLMQTLVKAAAQVLGDAFDIEIVERHRAGLHWLYGGGQ